MENLICTACNYTTKKQGNYNRHIKSVKHLQKVNAVNYNNNLEKTLTEEIQWTPSGLPVDYQKENKNKNKNEYVCEYCNKSISRYNNVKKHLNSCAEKQKEEHRLKEHIKELNAQLELFKTKSEHYMEENRHYIEEVDHYKEETNYYKQMLREAGGLVKKSVSSLTYIVDNYNNAPALQTITMDEIKTLQDNEKQFIEDILSSYKHKTLGKYLGCFIIKIYKKNDPNIQSIWNTDDSRLTYLIKELFSNKSSNWIIDKKGVKTTEYLIDPLLLHIKKLLVSYQKNLVIPDLTLTHNSVEMEFILDNSKKIIELVNDIDDGIVSKEILKYISCHLRFDEKLIKKVIEQN